MAKPQPPAPPNPVATAQAQQGSNIGTAIAQSELGNVNRFDPYGSTTFQQTGGYTDPNTGQFIPQWSENSSLNPLAQAMLTGTEQAGNYFVNGPSAPSGGNFMTSDPGMGGAPPPGMMGGGTPTGAAGPYAVAGGSGLPGGAVGTLTRNAANSATTPLDVNQTANNSMIAGGPQALDMPVAQSAYNASTAFLAPQFGQQQKDLQDQLARQGISVGNDAYGNAENQLQNTQNNALTAAANNAVVTGANQANNMFGLALQGQNQNLGQQQTLQSNPLSLLSMIYGGGMGRAA